MNGWQPMRAKALQIADALQIDPPKGIADAELRTAERFLRWMADDRFTFLGYREYDLVTAPARTGRRPRGTRTSCSSPGPARVSVSSPSGPAGAGAGSASSRARCGTRRPSRRCSS